MAGDFRSSCSVVGNAAHNVRNSADVIAAGAPDLPYELIGRPVHSGSRLAMKTSNVRTLSIQAARARGTTMYTAAVAGGDHRGPPVGQGTGLQSERYPQGTTTAGPCPIEFSPERPSTTSTRTAPAIDKRARAVASNNTLPESRMSTLADTSHAYESTE